jgi:hypothetical protein
MGELEVAWIRNYLSHHTEHFVSSGISWGKTWATYTKKPGHGMHRVKSKYLPLRATKKEAERDLYNWLQGKH